jgi:phosphopentomutase
MTPRPMARVVLLVMDSVGAGALPDAGRYGDEDSDTLGHVHDTVALTVPTLRRLGLASVARIGEPRPSPAGAFGRMAERSPGKDSVTGHWEMAGLVLDRAFPTFPAGFPRELMTAFESRIGRSTLGNVVASGTAIIDALGAEHMATGAPIVYTSADSVFQIAAHEVVIPIDELYRICHAAYELAVEDYGIGRVIARPFVGEPGSFVRTPNRRDFAMPPTGPTLLDRLAAAGVPVTAIGKVEDLFAGRGIARSLHTTSDGEGIDAVLDVLAEESGGLVFANFVDFDTQYGHRNDPVGYAANLEQFDEGLSRVLKALHPSDVLFVTADHGNDPTTPSTDHSREYVPLLAAGQPVAPGVDLGTRATYADLGQTIAAVFGVAPLASGTSFLDLILR